MALSGKRLYHWSLVKRATNSEITTKCEFKGAFGGDLMPNHLS